ncbi:MAG: UDP-N-acetylglucosamine--N-acetylmuramyl-(pentapeptide) pyrophosphoryl-undecaprenol [Actinomycetota bacterium]|nr:UDP-N-acetylglucosamine--N-acetylmuramyl-(pentapeptide) pyrophosphoryl-undecaprenol [Actinomycetota bacterium]
MKVVIAGGGTAGHVNPGLALARSLEGDEVSFLGTDRGAEARLVPQRGYDLHRIEVRGFDRSHPLSIFATAAKAAGAVRAARRKLRAIRPDAVVGMGGYVSLPASLAARSMGVPLVLHEQNIVFGLANRVAKPLAGHVAVSFEETLGSAGKRGVYTGNPVLPELTEVDLGAARAAGLERWGLDGTKKTLLVFGGSQGAKSINEAAAGLPSVWSDREDIQVLHITGLQEHDRISGRVGSAGGRLVYRVIEYADPMTEAYAVADLALCRGGATTVAELGVVGLPSIIVPYPYHRDKQQERHGRVLETAGAAVVVMDEEATPERIARQADAILGDDARRTAMRTASKQLGRPDAGTRLAAIVREAAR